MQTTLKNIIVFILAGFMIDYKKQVFITNIKTNILY